MPVVRALTVSVNGKALPMTVPVNGVNRWSLPEGLIDDQRMLLIGLQVSDTFCPADVMGSTDKRTLGAGVRRLVLRREAPAPCPMDTPVRTSREASDRGMLLSGWHSPEPWGCWTSGSEASMLLRFDAPLRDAYVLQFDLTPPLVDRSVTLSVNDIVLDTLLVAEGPNEWILPRDCTDGRTELVVALLVARPVRPMDVSDSRDDRILGVGVRNFRIRTVDGG
jgi:hypothetical protein